MPTYISLVSKMDLLSVRLPRVHFYCLWCERGYIRVYIIACHIGKSFILEIAFFIVGTLSEK